jgi:hypothetical protein
VALRKGAQLAAPVATLIASRPLVVARDCCYWGKVKEGPKAVEIVPLRHPDLPPLCAVKRQVPGGFAFNPPLTMQMVQSSALPGKSVNIV